MRILLIVINICGSALSALLLIVIVFGYETIAYVTGFPEILPWIALHSVCFIAAAWSLLYQHTSMTSLALNSAAFIIGALTAVVLMRNSLQNYVYVLLVCITIINLLTVVASKRDKATHPNH